MEIPVPFFFRIKGSDDHEGLLYVALEKTSDTTYYCLGSRKFATAKDGKSVWRVEQENGINAYYDNMPVSSMDIIYTDLPPMSRADTRAFLAENSHLLLPRHVKNMYTDGISYWYTPKQPRSVKKRSMSRSHMKLRSRSIRHKTSL